MLTVVAALLVRDNRLLIARRRPGETLAGRWEFPGGKVKKKEEPGAALARELAEEFDIRVKIGAFFGENVHCYDHASVRLWTYWALWLAGEISLSVHDRYRWVRIRDMARFQFSPADVPFVKALAQLSLECRAVLEKTPADVLPRRL